MKYTSLISIMCTLCHSSMNNGSSVDRLVFPNSLHNQNAVTSSRFVSFVFYVYQQSILKRSYSSASQHPGVSFLGVAHTGQHSAIRHVRDVQRHYDSRQYGVAQLSRPTSGQSDRKWRFQVSHTYNMCILLVYSKVVWVRHRDIHLLTVNQITYTSDDRFCCLHDADTDIWSLQVNNKWNI